MKRNDKDFTTYTTSLKSVAKQQKIIARKNTVDISKPWFKDSVHSHDYFELELVDYGSAIHLVNGKYSKVGRGDIYLLSPSDLHTLKPDPDADSSVISLFNFGFTEIGLSESSFLEILIQPKPISLKLGDLEFAEFRSMAQSILDEAENTDKKSEEIKSHLLCAFTMKFLRLYCEKNGISDNAGDENDEKSIEDKYVKKAIAYIKFNFRDKMISVPRIAASVDLSPNYFGVMFKRNVKMSCSNYIKKLRLEYARYLLTSSPLSVVSVAEICGYSNNSYFIADFRDEYGESPQKYREKYKAPPVLE